MQRLKDTLPNSWAQLLDEGIGLWGADENDWESDNNMDDRTLIWETRLYELLFTEYTAYRHEQIDSAIYLNRCPIPTDVHGIILSFLTPCPALPYYYQTSLSETNELNSDQFSKWTKIIQRWCIEIFTKHKSMSYGLVMFKTMGYDFSTFDTNDLSECPHLIITCFETKQYEKARFLLENGIKPSLVGYFDGNLKEYMKTPFAWSIENRGVDLFKRLEMLLEFGVDVNENEVHMEHTLIQYEMRKGIFFETNFRCWDVIELLIRNGADIYKNGVDNEDSLSFLKWMTTLSPRLKKKIKKKDTLLKRLVEMDRQYKKNKKRRLL